VDSPKKTAYFVPEDKRASLKRFDAGRNLFFRLDPSEEDVIIGYNNSHFHQAISTG